MYFYVGEHSLTGKLESIRLLYQGMLRDCMSSQKDGNRDHIVTHFVFFHLHKQHVVIRFPGTWN